MPNPLNGTWQNQTSIEPKQYQCGYCDSIGGSAVGWIFNGQPGQTPSRIYLCPYCLRPTFFEGTSPQPGIPFGGKVSGITQDVETLYQEARKCTSAGAYTAAVLACRKILMHTAVDKGADAGKSFVEYVTYLADKGFITPDAKGWVDAIRKKGNEANHEITLMDQGDAQNLLTLTEMMLKVIYEFPSRVPKANP